MARASRMASPWTLPAPALRVDEVLPDLSRPPAPPPKLPVRPSLAGELPALGWTLVKLPEAAAKPWLSFSARLRAFSCALLYAMCSFIRRSKEACTA